MISARPNANCFAFLVYQEPGKYQQALEFTTREDKNIPERTTGGELRSVGAIGYQCYDNSEKEKIDAVWEEPHSMVG